MVVLDVRVEWGLPKGRGKSELGNGRRGRLAFKFEYRLLLEYLITQLLIKR